MSDLSSIQATETVRLVGSDAVGDEQTPIQSTTAGGLHINLRDNSGNEIGITSDQIKSADTLNVGTGTQGALTVGTTAVAIQVGGSALTNRKDVTLYNNSAVIVYWGYTSAVTTTTGTPIFPGDLYEWSVGASQPLFVIAATASNNTRITEAA